MVTPLASAGAFRELRAGSRYGDEQSWGDLSQVVIRLVRIADLGQIGPLGTDAIHGRKIGSTIRLLRFGPPAGKLALSCMPARLPLWCRFGRYRITNKKPRSIIAAERLQRRRSDELDNT